MPLEYVTLIGFGIVLLVAGYALGRRSARLDSLAGQYTRPKPKPRFIPQWLYFQTTPDWRAGFWQGLSTEMIGGIITAVLLGLVITMAQRAESEQRLIEQRLENERNQKQQLILQMGSPDNGFAVEAARQLMALGWLSDGTLENARLWGANLQGANLSMADLRGAHFQSSNLQGVFLSEANLMWANFSEANLTEANLSISKLMGTTFVNSNLLRANLSYTNLHSVNLLGANLEGVNFESTTFTEYVQLPDGTKWTPGTDMSRFTDPNHPDFWRSDDDYSPAYRGDSSEQLTMPPGE
mgnify:CR=1 FL=1